MGKTRTVLIGQEPKEKKSSFVKKVKDEENKKIHIAGLKGGQRIKIVEATEPVKTLVEPGGEEIEFDKSIIRRKKRKIRGKRYKRARAKVDKTKLYKLADAIKIVKETSFSRFDGTMELHLIVKKKGFNINVELPYLSGPSKRIEIASEATIKKIQEGKIDFDILLAKPEIMPKLVPFAKILGPKGLMPNPKNGTLIKSEKEASKFSSNILRIKTEKDAPLIHTVVGKVSQKDSELVKNIETIFDAIGRKQILKAYLKATMSPSVKVEIR